MYMYMYVGTGQPVLTLPKSPARMAAASPTNVAATLLLIALSLSSVGAKVRHETDINALLASLSGITSLNISFRVAEQLETTPPETVLEAPVHVVPPVPPVPPPPPPPPPPPLPPPPVEWSNPGHE